MPYGVIKVDQVTFTNAGVDQTISVSGLVASISGNLTTTGTISGNIILGGTTISGATITGTAGQFGTITGNTAGFTTVTGTTVTGTTATFTSGVFTNISGGTHTITSGVFASGTAANPSIAFQGDLNTGIYSPGADQVAISTNGTGRLFVDASGNVGVGTNLPEVTFEVAANVPTIQWRDLNGPADNNKYRITIDLSQNFVFQAINDAGTGGGALWYFSRNGSNIENLISTRGATERLRLSNWDNKITFSNALGVLGTATAHDLQVLTNNTERARIDSSGRLLVGTSTARANYGNGTLSAQFQVEGTGFSNSAISTTRNSNDTFGAAVILNKSRGTAVGSNTLPSNGDEVGGLHFQASDGTEFVATARIDAFVDGTPGADDMPGRLVFSTTADGASSPTERMRIASNGVITIQNGAVAVIGTLTDGATITPDLAADCNFTVTLGGNRTLANPTNITAGQSGSIFIVQDATGSRTLAFGSSWDFPGGTAPTLSTAANAVDRIDYVVRSSTSIHTVFTANYS